MRRKMQTAWRHNQVDFAEYSASSPVTNLFKDDADADFIFARESDSVYTKQAILRVLLREAAPSIAPTTPIFVVIIPMLPALTLSCEEPLSAPVGARSCAPAFLTDSMSRIAAQSGLPHRDLFALFKASEPRKLYFADDGHWNRTGQALAARVVAEDILQSRVSQRLSNLR